MSKKTKVLMVIFLVIIAIIGYLIFKPTNNENKTKEEGQISQEEESLTKTPIRRLDPKNCTYVVNGEEITLKEGRSEINMENSSVKIITTYFGNEVMGDFNKDGAEDIAFLLTQETGGSGTFFYIAAALDGSDKCSGTNAILLGDRIAPQNIEFRDGEIIANYAQRNQDEAMTASPSAGVSKYFKITGEKLEEINI